MTIWLPYGKGRLPLELPENRIKAVLRAGKKQQERRSPEELVRGALAAPIGSPPLYKLAQGKKNVVVLISDHTRPVPSRVILPPMLEEIRRGSPEATVTLLVATGCHRGPTHEELLEKLGPELMDSCTLAVHDCDDQDNLCSLGRLPSGGELILNRMAVEADLLVAEGFIEPHFFAGFSGGRKSVLPGVAARETVLYNHSAGMIHHPKARTGILEGNPIHKDMVFAARQAKLAFICNVVLDEEKTVIAAYAGDVEQAHQEGCAFLRQRCSVPAEMARIVVSTNGGAPLDQNIYQAVKGMTAAEATVEEGGVIIMVAECRDGHGGESFFQTFHQEPDLKRMMETFFATPPKKTRIDQWQSQIMARVLQKAPVIFVSQAPEEMVRAMHLLPARSLQEALEMAGQLAGDPLAPVTVIPDGVGVIVQ